MTAYIINTVVQVGAVDYRGAHTWDGGSWGGGGVCVNLGEERSITYIILLRALKIISLVAYFVINLLFGKCANNLHIISHTHSSI